MRVGNRCRAHFKTFLGQFKLLNNRQLIGVDRLQVLSGVNDVKISLGNAQDQILSRLNKISFRLNNLLF